MTEDLLAVYVGDHLVGAAAGVALFRRSARNARGTAAGPALERLTAEVVQDQQVLRTLARRLGVTAQRPREAVGALAEKAGRLKLNGRVLRRSALSDLVELEGLELGVRGKAAGWRSLRAVAGSRPQLDAAALDALAERADRQAEELGRLRLEAAARVLSGG